MQTVEQLPAGQGVPPPEPPGLRSSNGPDTEPDLQLLLNWSRDPDETFRFRAALSGTIVVHMLLILGLSMMPRQNPDQYENPERQRVVTKIYDPPTELTQKTPNRGKVTKELAVQSPVPAMPVPTPSPGVRARKFIPPAPQPQKQPGVAPSLVEPPKVEQAQNTPQISLPDLPQIQPQVRPPSDSKPKLAFETPAAPPVAPSGPSRIQVPGDSVQEAVRQLSRGGSTGSLSGSDAELGRGPGLNIPPSPGRPRMDYEMKFDPGNVDFKPYILRVLSVVRQNWFAVYPESAKLGTRGQVKLEFAISKEGKVTKVVFSSQSGTWALDRAAVDAISMSNPFPALPAEFHGDRIVLAFTFSYNLGR